MITWQSRRQRRPSRAVGMAAALLVIPGVTGAALMWAQQAGQVHLEGPYRLIPIGLVLVAIAVQIIAVTRAALRWLSG